MLLNRLWILQVRIQFPAEHRLQLILQINPVASRIMPVKDSQSKCLWDFGDGSNSNEQNPSHKPTYTKEENYTVNFITVNFIILQAVPNSGTVKKSFIQISPPVVILNGLPQNGCAPLTHKFSSTIKSLEAISKYHWDFGDGNSSDLQPPHIFSLHPDFTQLR